MRHLSKAVASGRSLIRSRHLRQQGELWNDQVEKNVKADVAILAESDPASALNPHKRSSLDATINALKIKLNAIAISNG